MPETTSVQIPEQTGGGFDPLGFLSGLLGSGGGYVEGQPAQQQTMMAMAAQQAPQRHRAAPYQPLNIPSAIQPFSPMSGPAMDNSPMAVVAQGAQQMPPNMIGMATDAGNYQQQPQYQPRPLSAPPNQMMGQQPQYPPLMQGQPLRQPGQYGNPMPAPELQQMPVQGQYGTIPDPVSEAKRRFDQQYRLNAQQIDSPGPMPQTPLPYGAAQGPRWNQRLGGALMRAGNIAASPKTQYNRQLQYATQMAGYNNEMDNRAQAVQNAMNRQNTLVNQGLEQAEQDRRTAYQGRLRMWEENNPGITASVYNTMANEIVNNSMPGTPARQALIEQKQLETGFSFQNTMGVLNPKAAQDLAAGQLRAEINAHRERMMRETEALEITKRNIANALAPLKASEYKHMMGKSEEIANLKIDNAKIDNAQAAFNLQHDRKYKDQAASDAAKARKDANLQKIAVNEKAIQGNARSIIDDFRSDMSAIQNGMMTGDPTYKKPDGTMNVDLVRHEMSAKYGKFDPSTGGYERVTGAHQILQKFPEVMQQTIQGLQAQQPVIPTIPEQPRQPQMPQPAPGYAGQAQQPQMPPVAPPARPEGLSAGPAQTMKQPLKPFSWTKEREDYKSVFGFYPGSVLAEKDPGAKAAANAFRERLAQSRRK